MYSNYVEIRKCCSSRNVLKMLPGPRQPDMGRCHSVGTSVWSRESRHTYIKIDNFNVDKHWNEIDILDEQSLCGKNFEMGLITIWYHLAMLTLHMNVNVLRNSNYANTSANLIFHLAFNTTGTESFFRTSYVKLTQEVHSTWPKLEKKLK